MNKRLNLWLLGFEKFFFLAFLFLLLGLTASQIHSFDVFWQLQTGKYMVETSSIIRQDIFTLAADAPRFEHMWMHDIILYFSYLAGGYEAISILKGLLLTGTAALLAWTARIRGASWTAILLIFPAAFLLTNGHWLARPQLWSYLFFALFLLLLERHKKFGGKLLWLLIPAMLAWVNMHGAAVLAFPIMAAYLFGEGLRLLPRRTTSRIRSYASLWVLLIALLGTTFATPYGGQVLKTLAIAPGLGGKTVKPEAPVSGPVVENPTLPLHTAIVEDPAGKKRSGSITQVFNMDWRPVSFWRDRPFFISLIIGGGLLILGWRRLSLTDLFLLAGLTIMSLKLYRHTPFLYMGIAAFLPVYLDAAIRPAAERLGIKLRMASRMTVILAAFAIGTFLVNDVHKIRGFFNLGLRDWNYPVAAAEFVKKHHLPANLYQPFEWGGYLMWTLFPQYKVFWDGRADSREMFADGLQISRGEEPWQKILARHEVNTLVLSPLIFDLGGRRGLIDPLRQANDWALVFADRSSLVFVRAEAVDSKWLSQHRLPLRSIDDTILAQAELLYREDPMRYKALREVAGVYLRRKELLKGLSALETYLRITPEPDPEAAYYYRTLYPMVKGRPAPPLPST